MSDDTKDKKAKGKYAHLNDYKLNEDGEYEYAGLYHEWVSDEVRAPYTDKAKLLLGVDIACLVIAGCVPAPGTFGAFYVLVPFICAVIGTVLSTTAIVRLIREGSRVRDHIYEKSVPMLPAKLAIAGAGSLSSAMGELAHILAVGAGDKLAFAIAFVLVMLAAGACMLVLLNASMPLARGEAWKRN